MGPEGSLMWLKAAQEEATVQGFLCPMKKSLPHLGEGGQTPYINRDEDAGWHKGRPRRSGRIEARWRGGRKSGGEGERLKRPHRNRETGRPPNAG